MCSSDLAYQRCKYMHRDVSAGNLLIRPRIAVHESTGAVSIWWQGLLADWELAKHTDVKIALQPQRTVCPTSKRVWYRVSDLFLRAPGTSCPRTSSLVLARQQQLQTNSSPSCTSSSTVRCAVWNLTCTPCALSWKPTSPVVIGTLRPRQSAALTPSGIQLSSIRNSSYLGFLSSSERLDTQQKTIL